jgi:hypothetical protein
MAILRCVQRRWFAAAVSLLAVAGTVGIVRAETPQPPAPPAETVIVEVLGFAPLTKGKSIQQVHSEALRDARRNALIQAHSMLEVESLVEEMRLTEEVVRSRAAGYVQEMEVLEAGPVPDADPPTYRVRARALVRPLPQMSVAAVPPLGSQDVWRPKLKVLLTSNLPGAEHEAGFRSELILALRRCGVDVVPPDEPAPVLVSRVRVTATGSGQKQWTRIVWEMGAADPAEAQGEEGALPSVLGDWMVTEAVSPDGSWWQRVAVAVAQDAVRLWAAPRDTTVTVVGTNELQARKLAEALGTAPGARVELADDFSQVRAVVRVAGEPLQAVEALLRAAQVQAALDASRVTLTNLTFKVVPSTEAGPTPAAGSE